MSSSADLPFPSSQTPPSFSIPAAPAMQPMNIYNPAPPPSYSNYAPPAPVPAVAPVASMPVYSPPPATMSRSAPNNQSDPRVRDAMEMAAFAIAAMKVRETAIIPWHR